MKKNMWMFQGAGWIALISAIWFASAIAAIGQAPARHDEPSLTSLVKEVQLLRADLQKLSFENRKLLALVERVRNLELRVQREQKAQVELENQMNELEKFREMRKNELLQLDQRKSLIERPDDRSAIDAQIETEKRALVVLDETERSMRTRNAAMLGELMRNEAKLNELNDLLDACIQSTTWVLKDNHTIDLGRQI